MSASAVARLRRVKADAEEAQAAPRPPRGLGGLCSPIPPVNTSTSSPFMAAAMAAISRRSRCRYTSMASRGGRVAGVGGARTSRMSPDLAARDSPASPADCSRPGGDLVDAQVAVLEQPDDQPGIDAAAAGGHDQAFQRREAHRGVDAAAALRSRLATRPRRDDS